MSDYYELISESAPPVSLADMKLYLKITTAASDALITSLLGVATEYGEKYTGRSFRVQTFNLLTDVFTARICLRRSPVDTIDHVKNIVSGSQVTIATSVYYLKKGQWFSEILLQDEQEWPSDTDPREQAIEIQFSTTGYTKAANLILNGIKMHVAYMFFNRGDCDDTAVVETGEKSGANNLYNSFRISRV